MKLASADYLGFSDLAEAWASDPGSRSYGYILAQLLSAYWQGAFETLLDTTPDHWPQRLVTYRALKGCAGLPPEGLPIEDAGEPNWNGLSGGSTGTSHAPCCVSVWAHSTDRAGPSYGLPGQPATTVFLKTLSGLDLLRPKGLNLHRR